MPNEPYGRRFFRHWGRWWLWITCIGVGFSGGQFILLANHGLWLNGTVGFIFGVVAYAIVGLFLSAIVGLCAAALPNVRIFPTSLAFGAARVIVICLALGLLSGNSSVMRYELSQAPPRAAAATPTATAAYMPYPVGMSNEVCTNNAIRDKWQYVNGLLTQFEDPNARSISESQIAKIWDGKGLCDGTSAQNTDLTRASKTIFFNIAYFGDYLSAIVKWRNHQYRATRYFVDDFTALEGIIQPIARERGWDNWISLDKKFRGDMQLYDHALTKLGYPKDADLAAASHLFQ